jgi:hypothetical protein
MELRYAFDSTKWRLGKLCQHGHEWPGTGQSLRRIHPKATACAGCTGRKTSDWLVSFIDYKSMDWPETHRLAKLCPHQHRWNDSNLTIKISGKCLGCAKLRSVKSYERLKQDSTRLALERKRQADSYQRRRDKSPEFVESERRRLREYQAQRRALHGRPSRSKRTTEEKELQVIHRAIRQAGRSPTVFQLLVESQRLYWRENPDAQRQRANDLRMVRWRIRYQSDPGFRLYHREKSKRRKAQARRQSPSRVPISAIRQRFNEFSNCCAYCGQEGDMQIEHVEPICDGGLHNIGNIVPACWSCNSSKRANKMESWYRQQPFFSELRLARIRKATHRPDDNQLAFALA